MNLGRFSFALNSLQSMSWKLQWTACWTWHHRQSQLRRGRDWDNVAQPATRPSKVVMQARLAMSSVHQFRRLHFQGTTLTSEWRDFQRAASPFNAILAQHSYQDVHNIFPVGVTLGNQCDANTEKHGISQRNILKDKIKVWCKKGVWLWSNNV